MPPMISLISRAFLGEGESVDRLLGKGVEGPDAALGLFATGKGRGDGSAIGGGNLTSIGGGHSIDDGHSVGNRTSIGNGNRYLCGGRGDDRDNLLRDFGRRWTDFCGRWHHNRYLRRHDLAGAGWLARSRSSASNSWAVWSIWDGSALRSNCSISWDISSFSRSMLGT